MGVARDDGFEEDLFRVVRGTDGKFCHDRDIVHDSRNVLGGIGQSRFQNAPDGAGASEGEFPVLLDGVDLAEVDEDTVLDGLLAGVGMVSPNTFSLHIGLSRSARMTWITECDLIATCRWAIFASHPKVKAVT